jgi:thiamine pyrophosphokinase
MVGEELTAQAVACCDLLVAVDGGADALARIGLALALLVGDLDSISPAVRADLEDRGVKSYCCPPRRTRLTPKPLCVW